MPISLKANLDGSAEILNGATTVLKINTNNTVQFLQGGLSYYDQSEKFSGSQKNLNIPLVLVMVNNTLTRIDQQTVNIDNVGLWDNATFAVTANRAGKDFYVYAVEDSTSIVLSANSTFPTGYTALNTRKIGGFHCLCVSVGTIAGHTLSGYIAGDILPRSVWDLKNRSAGRQEGTVLSRCGKWIDIYLPSVSGNTLVSVNNGTIADGASSPAFHTYKFEQWFSRQGMSTISQQEFFSAAEGANQSTSIAGSADPITTTGHVDTAGRRMISNEGVEDTCGVLWQWGRDTGGVSTSAAWADAYDANDDSTTRGRHYQAPYRCLLGGPWDIGVFCGVRASAWDISPLFLNAHFSARGVCEPAKNTL